MTAGKTLEERAAAGDLGPGKGQRCAWCRAVGDYSTMLSCGLWVCDPCAVRHRDPDDERRRICAVEPSKTGKP